MHRIPLVCASNPVQLCIESRGYVKCIALREKIRLLGADVIPTSPAHRRPCKPYPDLAAVV
jgi:hypothetical protein